MDKARHYDGFLSRLMDDGWFRKSKIFFIALH